MNPSNGLPLAGTLDKVYDGYLMSVHPETGELLFSDAIDEAERTRLAGDHTRLRKTPTAEQAVYVGRTTSASLRTTQSAPPSCAISPEVLRVPAGSLRRRAGGRAISRAA